MQHRAAVKQTKEAQPFGEVLHVTARTPLSCSNRGNCIGVVHSPPDILMDRRSFSAAAEHRATGAVVVDDDDDDAVATAVVVNSAAAFLNPAVRAGKKPDPLNPCAPLVKVMQAMAVHERRIIMIVQQTMQHVLLCFACRVCVRVRRRCSRRKHSGAPRNWRPLVPPGAYAHMRQKYE